MTKQILTKKQQAARRKRQRDEQARLEKLLKSRPKIDSREISVNAIPSYEYDDPVNAKALPSAQEAPEVLRSQVDYLEHPELAAREALAQEEKDRKRKRLAPLYNKGPYMLITDDADITSIGRK